jgi:Cdc6-like AAA superfamily ATPase
MTYTTTDKAWHSTGINCLVYGRAGVGKTMLTATAPKPLLISAEAGLLSLRHVSVPVKIVHTLTDIYDVFNDITAGRGSRSRRPNGQLRQLERSGRDDSDRFQG